ncbi:MAG TPA: ATP-binding protein [Thermoguttaceae bacterium]|nr:ATP-binding protein [Thermoguttaceae bacterium]
MSEDHWIWQCEHVIPSDTASGRRILGEVLGQLQSRHWRAHDVFGVHLAMEEALVNAIQHGNRFDEDKQVRIACRIAPELVHIEITDEGDGFDPTAVPDPTELTHLAAPGGRGVMLMKAFMTRVQYNASGNRVILEKERGDSRNP